MANGLLFAILLVLDMLPVLLKLLVLASLIKSGTYNESNSWQYTGSATKIRICVDQRDSTSDNMYYPYVWVEEISESTKYTVSKGTETNGTFSVSSTSAAEGDTVTVTTSPSNGYEVDTVTYTLDGGSATTISGSNNTYTFTMPAANVTVNVSFKATSTAVTVTATKVAQVHDFTVYFKCASAPAYKPYVSLDGATAVAMTQGTELKELRRNSYLLLVQLYIQCRFC